MKRPHLVPVVVLIAGIVVVGAAATIAEVSHRDTEQRLLDQRTGEAGAVLSTAISALQTPLTSAADLASATNGDPAAFEAVMTPLAGDGKRFVAASLYSTASDVPLVNVGQPTVMTKAGGARTRAMLDQVAGASQLAVVDLLDLPGRHLGYAFRSSEQPARYVVYAEVALPPRTSASRTTGPFQDLNYATYLENGQAGDELLYASVAEVPIRGRTARTVVPFGDRQLVLVTTTSVSLGGQLSRALPWLIALLGAALVILGAIVAERLLRRRNEAEALAADVSRLYEDQRHRAETLQRSLLPHELPQPPGVMAHARYWPADRSSQIGGDFYDLFPLAGDRWGVIIGDVCGKGIEAAALTGVTRHTIRAAARHLESPADVLHWTYEAISAYSTETYATVCFAVLDLSHHEPQLDIALGGHPGPILCRADGTVEMLGTPGTVLGLVEPRVTRTRHELTVGDTLVFYTDGVTDAPGERAVSMDDLTQAIVTAAPAGPAETADAIRVRVRRHRPEGNGDDTAILVLRLGDVVAASAAPHPNDVHAPSLS
jgi:serine phosphatase RsbU (regulator of sigma subunit)/type II secretory pathway pseudopilin PulG